MTDQWDGWPDEEPDPGDADQPGGGLGEPDFASEPLDLEPLDPAEDTTADGDGPGFHGPGFDGPGGGDGLPALGYGDDEGMGTVANDGGTGDTGDGEEAGLGAAGPGDPTIDADNPTADADALVGADPDLDPLDDPTAGGSVFPAPLEIGEPPVPVDGHPWTDAGLLGGDGVTPLPDPLAGADGAPTAADLFAYAGEDAPAGEPGWAGLLASPDPATSALARFWATRD